MKPILRKGKTWVRRMQEKWFQEFIFIHINKTAGSSIEKALGMRFEHRTAREKRRELGERRWKERFSFTFVRNPWDKVVSHYHYRKRTKKAGLAENPPPFKEWVVRAYREQDPALCDNPTMFLPQWDWITDEEGQVLVDFIGRFEKLDEDFGKICQQIGREARLPHLKKSQRGDFREYYDDETADVVRQWFHEDIKQFGYEF